MGSVGWDVGPNELVGVGVGLHVCEEVSDGDGGLDGDGARFLMAPGLESDGAVVQHLLGIVACV